MHAPTCALTAACALLPRPSPQACAWRALLPLCPVSVHSGLPCAPRYAAKTITYPDDRYAVCSLLTAPLSAGLLSLAERRMRNVGVFESLLQSFVSTTVLEHCVQTQCFGLLCSTKRFAQQQCERRIAHYIAHRICALNTHLLSETKNNASFENPRVGGSIPSPGTILINKINKLVITHFYEMCCTLIAQFCRVFEWVGSGDLLC